ncbi:ParA family protein [Methanobacterium aggregans]|uniref:ParA family protein n=1 Tax=Methanobacterium aggregans TaxID=1615586 RepID=UPI001AE53264|nr:ParA family protein [Methanobacterium aggregans]MBP2046007.1 chromosome partitioning protein [Methanobacterium aggregans]
MAEIIAILNQKGGCGKTTTAVNLSAALAQFGRKVLVIDMDPQGNATMGLGVDKRTTERTIYDVLTGDIPLGGAIMGTDMSGLDVVPSNISLSGAEVELSKEVGYHTILDMAVDGVSSSYDYIFIDVPPSLGILALNSLVAADSVIIPIQAEYYALEGIADLMKTIELVESRLRSPAPIKGILITLYDSRTRLGREVYSNVKEYFGQTENIFKTTIPRNVKLAEAPSFGESCITYDAESSGAKAYLKLAGEIIQLEGTEDNK